MTPNEYKELENKLGRSISTQDNYSQQPENIKKLEE